MRWSVEYDDNGFWETWTVIDGHKSFDCSSRGDAEFLRCVLITLDRYTYGKPFSFRKRVPNRLRGGRFQRETTGQLRIE